MIFIDAREKSSKKSTNKGTISCAFVG